MATQQHESRKKWALKKVFSQKKPQDFELLKQVPESSHQTSYFGWNQYVGTLILSKSAFPRIVWLTLQICRARLIYVSLQLNL